MAKSSQTAEKNEAPPSQTASVTLPSFLGIKPVHYIPVIYGAALFLLLFSLTLLPGLVAPGARVRVTSQPPNAAVFFGETAYGATPVEVFVPAGETILVLKRPGFPDYSQNVSIPNNPFLGIVFPARLDLEATMVPGDTYVIMARFQKLLSEYALSAPFEENRQPPPLFSEVFLDLTASGLSREEATSYVTSFLPFATDYYLYRNLRRSLDNTEPGTLPEEKEFWRTRLPFDNLPFLDVWLFSTRTLGEKNTLLREGFFSDIRDKLALQGNAPVLAASSVTGFSELKGGTYRFGPELENPPIEDPWEYPYASTLQRVLIQQRMVTQAEYARFVASNPEWSLQNKNLLEEKGWVDARYLEGWIENRPPNPGAPVVNVSYEAALAYASWYQAPTGWKARLPYDPEWEAASKAGLTGNNLEWMLNAWSPGEFLLRTEQQPWKPAPAGMAPGIRGLTEYNWGQDALTKRAVLPRHATSQLLGFRLVLEVQ